MSTPILSFVIPTFNRARELRFTLDHLGKLGFAAGEAEVIVVDNASTEMLSPEDIACNLPTTVLRAATNLGAAGRNLGADAAHGRWVVMLDDDSSPTDARGLIAALEAAPADAAAVMADIHLSDGRGRERGGLPEVFIGCGVAIRREAFLDTGGYDASFGYYAEEYDLAAKLMLAGHYIVFDPRFTVEHRKVQSGRCMDTILHRLVRNTGWVMQRYAPEGCRRGMLHSDRKRYREIACKENAIDGYTKGITELRRTIHGQLRTPMDDAMFARFTGRSHVRTALVDAMNAAAFKTAAIVDHGKNAWCIEQVLDELGVQLVENPKQTEVVIPGTMSPGPMLDSAAAWQLQGARVVCPWKCAQQMLEEHAAIGASRACAINA